MDDRSGSEAAQSGDKQAWSPLANEILGALPRGEFRAFASAEAAAAELTGQAPLTGVYVLETWKYAWVAESVNIAESLAEHMRKWVVGAFFYKITAADLRTDVRRISDVLTNHGIVDIARRW